MCAARGADVNELRNELAECRAKVHALEVANYSLGLHLKQATSAGGGHGHSSSNPDVY